MTEKRSQLPVLPQIQINTPCPKDWDEMKGTDAKRFCSHCQLHVHNFSEMQEQEVQSLMNSGDRVCARMTRRSDGTLVTKETPQRLSRRGWLAKLSSVAAAAAAMFVSGCETKADRILGEAMNVDGQYKNGSPDDVKPTEPKPSEEVFMGDVEVPDDSHTMLGGAFARPPAIVGEVAGTADESQTDGKK